LEENTDEKGNHNVILFFFSLVPSLDVLVRGSTSVVSSLMMALKGGKEHYSDLSFSSMD